jgi:hypothetical protein
VATPEPRSKRVEITVSTRTLLTVLGTLAVAWAFIEARQAVLWVFVALSCSRRRSPGSRSTA